jgi:hypothetical protein
MVSHMSIPIMSAWSANLESGQRRRRSWADHAILPGLGFIIFFAHGEGVGLIVEIGVNQVTKYDENLPDEEKLQSSLKM